MTIIYVIFSYLLGLATAAFVIGTARWAKNLEEELAQEPAKEEKGKVQFISPQTFDEKYKAANKVDDLLDG